MLLLVEELWDDLAGGNGNGNGNGVLLCFC